MSKPELCYLCGLSLGKGFNLDHVPAKQFFAPAVRKKYNTSKLLTIPTHRACNSAYKSDEDYFLHTIMPFAIGSEAGDAIYHHVLQSYRKGKNRGLVKKVLAEFDRNPSGLILPGNKVVKQFDGERLNRVAWKIVRGLYFDSHHVALPENLPVAVTLTAPGEQPPEHFLMFNSVPNTEAGPYPGAFAYRNLRFDDRGKQTDPSCIIGRFCFWDRIIMTVVFHDPSCAREECEPKAV